MVLALVTFADVYPMTPVALFTGNAAPGYLRITEGLASLAVRVVGVWFEQLSLASPT